METISKLLYLTCKIESLEKVVFLTIMVHLTTLCEEKGEGMHVIYRKVEEIVDLRSENNQLENELWAKK